MMYFVCFFVGVFCGVFTISIFAYKNVVEAECVIDKLEAEIETLKQHLRWEK